MRNDTELIVKTYPKEWESMRVYAIGDVHVGSAQFNSKAIEKKIRFIAEDEQGVVTLCGDLGDYGLKNSKTNVYEATMHPKQQQEYIYELFKPIKDKIVSVTPGNHEDRITREVGLSPLYDLCVLWGHEEVYRENLAILKLSFGTNNNRNRQNTFIGVTSHGSSKNKHKKFIASIHGADFYVSGHTHTPEYSPHGRLVIDSRSATANVVPFKEIVVDANLTPGGYGLKKEYEIAAPPELQYLELSVQRKDRDHHMEKVINFHSIQI